jgi:hypothetical protein
MRKTLGLAALTATLVVIGAGAASAKTCYELQQLCWTMRSDKNDCTRPYQRCLSTGTFVTPLGRVFKATK